MERNFTVYGEKKKPLTVTNKSRYFRVKLLNQGSSLKMSISADGKVLGSASPKNSGCRSFESQCV